MKFKEGDLVEWTSQAGGFTKTKIGKVIEVVPKGAEPKTKLRDRGYGRSEESYVVLGHRKGIEEKDEAYWPRVGLLRPAFYVFNEATLRQEIERVWGSYGAHIEVYDAILRRAGLGHLAAPRSVEEAEDRKTLELLNAAAKPAEAPKE